MNTITFKRFSDLETKNSYTNWGLILKPKSIAPPTPKIITMDIAGRDGSIDLTEWAGETRYNDRVFTLSFYMAVPFSQIEGRATGIKNWLHGQRVQITFFDDSAYYLDARVSVSDAYFDGGIGFLDMDIIAKPYKLKQAITSRTENITTRKLINITNDRMRTRPKFITDGAYTITKYGKNIIPRSFPTRTNNGVTFTADGNGGVTISGTATGGNANYAFIQQNVPAGTYTVSGFPVGSNGTYSGWVYTPNDNVSRFVYTGSLTFTIDEPQVVYVSFRVWQGQTVNNLYFIPQYDRGNASSIQTFSVASAGTYQWTNYLFHEGENRIRFQGTGSVTIKYQEGAL